MVSTHLTTVFFLGCILQSYVICEENVAEAVITTHPFFATIEAENQTLCSATIIDDFYVLTSNSCVGAVDLNQTEVYVRAGTNKLHYMDQSQRVIKSISDNKTDLLLLQMSSNLNYDDQTHSANLNLGGIIANQSGDVTYWNTQKKNSLLKSSNVYVLDSQLCATKYEGLVNITAGIYCLEPEKAKTKTHCKADIGAPYFYNEQLYGQVVSNEYCHKGYPLLVQGIHGFTAFIINELSGYPINIGVGYRSQ